MMLTHHTPNMTFTLKLFLPGSSEKPYIPMGSVEGAIPLYSSLYFFICSTFWNFHSCIAALIASKAT